MKPVSKPNRTELKHWSDNLKDRQCITDFWDWLCEANGEVELLSINIEEILDRYHNIDKRQLEKERRALLSSIKQ